MPIITLTTDFGTKDPYLSAVKGKIYSLVNNAAIVDISHDIAPFNVPEAAYILNNAYRNFPEGTIHIVGIDTAELHHHAVLIAKINNHYFIASDNGVLSLLKGGIEQVVAVKEGLMNTSFPTLNIFVDLACKLLDTKDISTLGEHVTTIKELSSLNATVNDDKSQITGNIIYIDNYGNIVTSITKQLFSSIMQDRSVEIVARTYVFKKVYESYADFVRDRSLNAKVNLEGERLALFNSAGFLQISIYKGSKSKGGTAFSLLGLYPESTTITINAT